MTKDECVERAAEALLALDTSWPKRWGWLEYPEESKEKLREKVRAVLAVAQEGEVERLREATKRGFRVGWNLHQENVAIPTPEVMDREVDAILAKLDGRQNA